MSSYLPLNSLKPISQLVSHPFLLSPISTTGTRLKSCVMKTERQNIKVVADPSLTAQTHNPYLLTPQQEREMRTNQSENRERLQVPRRPQWTRKTTVLDLERTERDAFLEWRRGLAEFVFFFTFFIYRFLFLCDRTLANQLTCKI